MNAPKQDPMGKDVPAESAVLHTLYEKVGGVRGVFSSKVSDYTAARPGYPDALYDALRETGALPPAPALVADLGSGTGLFSAGLLKRGYQVFAVEPNGPMRAAAEEALGSSHDPGFHSIDGSAEATTLPDASVDLVTAAQAFHWFEVEAARAECLRILRPGGQVALIWNDRVLSDPLQAAIEDIFAEFGGATREALANQEQRSDARAPARFFGTAEVVSIDLPHEQILDRDGLLSLVFSRSYMPPRDSDAGRGAMERAEAVFRAHADGNGRVALRYRTTATVGRPVG